MGALASGLRIAGAENSARTGLRAAVRHIHLEDVEGGRDAELVPLRQHQRVDAVDGLRDGGDGDLVRVALEDVQRDAGQQRVAHGGLLRQVVSVAERCALAVPRAPLVHHQLDGVLAGLRGLRDGGPVAGDDALHETGAGQQVVVVVRVELERVPGGELRGLPEV